MVKDKAFNGDEEYVKIEFLSKLKQLFFNPSNFLKRIEREKDYQPILRIFILLSLSYFILVLAINLLIGSIEIFNFLIGFVFAVIISIALAFAIPGLVHIFVIIIGGRGGFFNTYKPITYAMILFIIYSSIILLISLILPIDSEELVSIQGAQDPEQLKQGFINYLKQPGAIINSILFLVMIVHISFFSIKGLSKYQKIPKSRAAFAVIATWAIILILYVLGAYFSQVNNLNNTFNQ